MGDNNTGEQITTKDSLVEDLMVGFNNDISETSDWREDVDELRRRRLGERKRRKPYINAPDFFEPVIDDNVRSVTSSENQLVWNSRYLAHFIPLDSAAVKQQRDVEVAFDLLLKMTLRPRARFETLLDSKNMDGFSVAKIISNDTAYERVFGEKRTIPDFAPVDILNIITPPSTKLGSDAIRLAEIIPMDLKTFEDNAKERDWKNWRELLNRIKDNRDANAQTSTTDHARHGGVAVPDSAGAPLRIGTEDVEDTVDNILIWEAYYWKKGKRRVAVFSPLVPDLLLEDRPWEMQPRLILKSVQQDEFGRVFPIFDIIQLSDRPWPYVQFRNEDRTEFWYDTRGQGKMLLSNQNAATQFANLRGIQYDYYAKPLLTGTSSTHDLENFTFEPGSKLPEGMDFAKLPQVDPSLAFSMDLEIAKAARRVGSQQGALFSPIGGRGDKKTATQVNQESLTSTLLNSDAVMRFSEPLGQLFNMMWIALVHNPVPLPIVRREKGDISGFEFLDEDVYNQKFLVQPAISGRDANPDFKLQQLIGLLPFFQNNPFVRQDQMTEMAVEQINPLWRDRIVVSEDDIGQSGAPIITELAQIREVLEQVAQQVQNHGEFLTKIAETEQKEGQTQGGGNGQTAQAALRAG